MFAMLHHYNLMTKCRLFPTGVRSRSYEAEHINDWLQEELEDGRSRGSAELCGSATVSKHRRRNLFQTCVKLLRDWCVLFCSDAFDFEYGTLMLRMSEGLDMAHIVEAEGVIFDDFLTFY